MDNSGNSGSLQSSSGGDEEYESRAAASIGSISAFMTNAQPTQPPPSFYDPFSMSYNLHLLNANTAWPGKSPRPNPNPSPIAHDSIVMPSFQQQSTAAGPAALATLTNSNKAPLLKDHNQNQNQSAAVRNPKKRSRASRRAPTTVLTTDTSNFRAMVQEFTGIPAPPFNSSPFPRARLDLFGGLGSSSAPPPYLRRPFSQKVEPHLPFLGTNNHYNTTTSNQLQFPVHVHDHQNSLNNSNQNPLLASLLQTNPKFPFSGSSITGSKPDDQSDFRNASNDGSHNKVASFDESCSGNQDNVSATISGLQTLISANQMSREDGNANDGHRANAEAGNGGYNNFKGPEKVAATRVEGMVESWICSSE